MKWLLAACVLAACAVAAASQRVEPNAFLAKKVTSVSTLIDQVSTDAEVADRYERHFGKSKSEVIRLFTTLHLARLNNAGTYRIYSVLPNGSIKAHAEKLKAGTRVFADASGMPILKMSCGNAMLTGSDTQSTALLPSVTQPNANMQAVSLTTPDSQIVANQTPVITPGSPIALSPEFPGDSPNSVSRNQGFGVVPILLAAFGGAASIPIGSSGGNTPVPEPATIVVMAGMLVALKMRRKK